MIWFYPVVPMPYMWPPVYPVFEERMDNIPISHEQQMPIDLQPYLQTWPYSNVYYGNYFES